MKKTTLLFFLMFISALSFGQVLNEAANWPNANWTVTGTYNTDPAAFEADPTLTSNFAFDEDDAGLGSNDDIAAESPVIDLTAAHAAGETWIFVSANYLFNWIANDAIYIQYWDADAMTWVTIGDPYQADTSSTVLDNFCSGGYDTLLSEPLNIAGFSATQLSGFRYRIYFNDNGTFGWGFCFESPTIYSQTPPTCPDPDALFADLITNSSAEIAWTEMGSATKWNIEYGIAPYTMDTNTPITVTDNPFALTGLIGNTTYELYVQADCGGGDTSNWIGPISFTTLCDPFTAPYSEDFENGGDLPNCWTQGIATSTSDYWEFYDAPPSGSHVGNNMVMLNSSLSGGYFATVDDSDLSATDMTSLTSPLIDVTTLTTPSLQFYLNSHNENQTAGNCLLTVDFFDGANWLPAIYTSQQNTVGWEMQTIDLSGYTITGLVQVRFVITGTSSFYDDVAIDDVMIDELPSCVNPTDVTITEVTNNSMTFTASQIGTPTGYQVEYGAPGFTIGSGTTVTDTAVPFTVTGLSPQTDYEFYVMADCGGGDTSFYVGPYAFTTYCDPAIAPFYEDFENAGDIPNCWEQGIATTASDYWEFYNAPPSGSHIGNNASFSNSSLSDGYFATVDDSDLSATDMSSLTTPLIDVSALTTPSLQFYLNSNNEGQSAGNCLLTVDFYDGANWNTAVYTSQSNTIGWEVQTVDLSGFTITGLVQVRFTVTGTSSFYDDVAIDDVMIDELPNCVNPSDVTITDITNNSMTFTASQIGNVEGYVIEYGAPGFAIGSGNIINQTSVPATLSPLAANTAYEFYVKADCTDGDFSDNVGPFSFTTLCDPIIAPYTEDFEASTSSIPSCWVQGENNTEDWIFSNTALYVEELLLSGYFAYVDDSSPNSTGTTLYSPIVDITALTAPSLTFNYYSDNGDADNVDFMVDIYDGTTWTNAYTSNADVLGWQNIVIDLAPYATAGTVQARFVVDENNGTVTTNDLAIDDVTFDEMPACPIILDVTSGTTTTDSVELTFTSQGSETSWIIEYGYTGYTFGSGTFEIATSNPFTLTGLESGTTYDLYIAANCGSGYSDIYGPITVTTGCGIYTAPYWEDFEANGSIPNCWTQGIATVTSDYWEYDDDPSGSHVGNNGTFTNSTFSGGFYAAIDDSDLSGTDQSSLTSPEIDVTALTTPAVIFYLNSNNEGQSAGNCTLSMDLYDGANWITDIYTNDTNTDGWEVQVVDLSGYPTTGPIQVRFVVTGTTSFYDDVAIDDVMIDELPSCDVPSGLASANETNDGFDLSWVENGTATTWNIEYGLAGFTQGTGTTINGVINNPATLETLMAATEYDVYVQADCGTSVSLWVGPLTVTTACDPYQVAPYTEDFENDGDIPFCWTQSDTDQEDWDFALPNSVNHVGFNGTVTGNTASDGYYAFVDDSNSPAGIGTTMYSPMVDITGLTNPVLSFYLISDPEDSDHVDFSVDVFDGTTWTEDVFFSNSDVLAWTKFYIDLAPYASNGGIVQVRFVVDENNTGFDDDVAIDDVSFVEAPTTPPSACPTNIVGIPDPSCGNMEANITWDAVAEADGYYMTMGTTPGGNNVLDNVNLYNSTSYSFNTAIGTTYYFTITPYNYAGSSTGCTENSFTSASVGCYCESVPTSNDGLGITNVSINGTDFPGTDVTYIDNTATTVNLYTLINNTFLVDFATGFTYGSNIWIDFNDDYVFDSETEELIISGTSTSANPTTLDLTFMLPAGATTGVHTMRLGTADSGQATPNPCFGGSFGVTIDFTVDIMVPACSPVTIASSTINPDCDNNQYFIDFDISDLGDGTPVITDGTNTWPVTTTGVTQVGPFTNGSTTNISITHGADSTCDLALGNFNYSCPPVNDDLCNATALPILNLSQAGTTPPNTYTNVAATAETNEPVPTCFSAGVVSSVWFSFVAPAGGEVEITTNIAGATLTDTEIALYDATGVTCSDLSTLGAAIDCAQDDFASPISFNSTMTFTGTDALVAGNMYYIQLDLYSGATPGEFAIEVVNQDTAITNTFEDFSFTYYPNPVKDNKLNLSSEREISSLNVINVLGQRVMTAQPNTSDYVLDMSPLASGTYFVEVQVGEKSKTIKIVKE